MEKTKEHRQASRERYLAQEAKAIKMLHTEDLYDFIDGLKYAYSFCLRYKKNLKDFIDCECLNLFKKTIEYEHLDECVKAGVLTPWKDTYYFNREKAESLQQYILENDTN